MKKQTIRTVLYIIALLAATNFNAFAQRMLKQTNIGSSYMVSNTFMLAPALSTLTSQDFAAIIMQGCTPIATALSSNQNYVVSYTVKQSGITNPADPGLSTCQISASVVYLDGMGRKLQTIGIKQSPGLRDIVQPFAYDEFGREQTSYLPYSASGASSDGGFKIGAYAAQQDFYNNPVGNAAPGVKVITDAAFSQSRIEASPLARMIEQGAPGAAWQLSQGNTIKIDYEGYHHGSTIDYDAVNYLASINPALSQEHHRILSANGSGYDELFVTITKDENWKSSDGMAGKIMTYKDKLDRVALKRNFNRDELGNIQMLSTYYVYDDFGNLSFVLPPGANPDNSVISQTALDDFCYQYRYDGKKRLIEKKLPGKGWEFMVYNDLGQVVLSQDANQAVLGQWLYSKYDQFGRVITTGIYSSTADRASLQAVVSLDGQSNSISENRLSGYDYTNMAFPRSAIDPLTINYYDSYDFPEGNTYAFAGASIYTKGLLTGSKIKVLGTTTFLLNLNFYDEDGRMAKNFSQHYLSGAQDPGNYDEIANSYNFSNELVSSTRIHHVGVAQTIIVNHYTYDHAGRKVSTKQSVNGQPAVVLSKLEYNELGQLIKKSLHSTDDGNSFLQQTELAYNERGWLKNSTSAEFSFQLDYEDGTVPQYNGNIANQRWAYGSNPALNVFSYSYDKVNRLLSAVSPNLGETISYDVMGNIKSLSRDGYGTNSYTVYEGNKLKSIVGFTNSSYLYDENGNLKSDSGKNITLTYNYLNLPTLINGSHTITYTYDASGSKLKKQSGVNGTNYINGIQYQNGNLEFIQTGEGIARNNGGTYSYEYNLTDHLGNVRTSFYKNPTTHQLEILQKDDYFAFGLRKVVQGGNNKYLYNGKELQSELEEYDYGARFYDPVVGRFNTIDPLSEKSRRNSPYSYALNNPIRFIDVDGMYAFEPTPNEAAVMAKHVYNDPKNPVELIGGWKVSGAAKGIEYDNKATGFKSALYERTIDGKTEYTYATAGTESGVDWENNATQLVGKSEQYAQSKANALLLKDELKGAELTFTGHSLGGGLAENNSIATGDKAITFNAAGVSNLTRGGKSGKSNTDAYIMMTDPLNAIQTMAGGVPRAGGERHYLKPKSIMGVLNGHSINTIIESLPLFLRSYGPQRP